MILIIRKVFSIAKFDAVLLVFVCNISKIKTIFYRTFYYMCVLHVMGVIRLTVKPTFCVGQVTLSTVFLRFLKCVE